MLPRYRPCLIAEASASRALFGIWYVANIVGM